MKTYRFIRGFILLLLVHVAAIAQPPRAFYSVNVTADHADWTYKKGEKASFTISVTQHGSMVKNCKVTIQIGPEQMPAIINQTKDITGPITIDGGTMNTPGFLRCVVSAEIDGKKYRGLATAAFDPQDIKPTTETPADFQQFWETAKAQAATIPMDPKLTLLTDRCTEKVNVYQLNIQNYRTGARLYGILCVPKKAGKYPALLKVPGAGIRPYTGDLEMAEKGMITLEIGIHGIPVILDNSVYQNLAAGPLSEYPTFNLDNRDKYYYKRVYLGCVRAIDYLYSMPEFDGSNLAVYGGSQGGALSIVTAGLDKRVKYLAALYPALSDVTGYLHNRAGGWPHMFNKTNAPVHAIPDKIATSKYYDVVNFAKLVTVPGFYNWGYNDEVCPPTSIYSAYNSIAAPKELFLTQEEGHWTFPETNAAISEWLVKKLITKKSSRE
jgi:cephalosporin-C deacetylase